MKDSQDCSSEHPINVMLFRELSFISIHRSLTYHFKSWLTLAQTQQEKPPSNFAGVHLRSKRSLSLQWVHLLWFRSNRNISSRFHLVNTMHVKRSNWDKPFSKRRTGWDDPDFLEDGKVNAWSEPYSVNSLATSARVVSSDNHFLTTELPFFATSTIALCTLVASFWNCSSLFKASRSGFGIVFG